MADNRIFDMAKLLESTCDDRDLAGQVVGVFLNDIPVQLNDLEAALAAPDAKTAERVAHSIKGASATVGGEQLREVALECERHAREGNLDAVKGLLVQVKDEYELLRTALANAGFTAE